MTPESTTPDREAGQRSSTVETALVGDGVTVGIVRIGNTVRRPVRPFTATVQHFLAYLQARGFSGAPQPLGYDELGREVLSYLDGDVPREPLPESATTLTVLEELARLVRRLHEAAEGFTPPVGAVWGAIPGTSSPTIGPARRRHPTARLRVSYGLLPRQCGVPRRPSGGPDRL